MPIRPRSGKPARRAPEKIMFQFFGARLFETENVAASGLTPDMTCRMAPSCRQRSKPENQQARHSGWTRSGVLQRAQLLYVSSSNFWIPLLDSQKGFITVGHFLEFDLFFRGRTRKIL